MHHFHNCLHVVVDRSGLSQAPSCAAYIIIMSKGQQWCQHDLSPRECCNPKPSRIIHTNVNCRLCGHASKQM
jgi:hypothetical protein